MIGFGQNDETVPRYYQSLIKTLQNPNVILPMHIRFQKSENTTHGTMTRNILKIKYP
jgi:hypothetical protein